MNPLPDNPDFDCITLFPSIPAEGLLYPENHCRARIALHPGCRLVGLEPPDGLSVDGHDLIPAAETRIGGRRIGIWLIDNDIALSIRLVDDRPDTSVCLADHELEVLIVLLRHIHRIWVEGLQHCIDSRTLDSVHRQGIHIRPVQFLDDGILDLGPFPEPETGRLRKGRGECEYGECREQIFLHFRFISIIHKCKKHLAAAWRAIAVPFRQGMQK